MKKLLLAAMSLSLLLSSCTVKDAVNLAVTGDPKKALESYAERKADTYMRDPGRVLRDMEAAKREYTNFAENLMKAVGSNWGKKETKIPNKTRYVKYTRNYKSRAQVDFDEGIVLVESIDDGDALKNLESAIVTTLLTPDDPHAVDLFSDKEIKLTGTPYLAGLVKDHMGRDVATPIEAEGFAKHLLANSLQKKTINTSEGDKSVSFVNMAMVQDHVDVRAKRFQPVVARYSEEYKISRSLVYAIIKTESNFNPYAVSPVPAYGLMQLVPASGGRDAYRRAKGVDRAPTKDYLFDSNNNIELGSAYLGLLMYSYLENITDPVSREYCAIASYNTGAGNVFKTFSKNGEKDAVRVINSLHPSEVYNRLKRNLPYQETRDYIEKVVRSKKEFVKI